MPRTTSARSSSQSALPLMRRAPSTKPTGPGASLCNGGAPEENEDKTRNHTISPADIIDIMSDVML